MAGVLRTAKKRNAVQTVYMEYLGIFKEMVLRRLNELAVLAFTLFISMMVSVQAQAFDADGLNYSITDSVNNTVRVNGLEFGNTELVIVIPSSVTNGGTDYDVTSIHVEAFRFTDLTSVTIPNSVTTIGDSAFGFNALTSVTIPGSVTTIGDTAFSSNALTSATFEGDFGTFSLNMFSSNADLETICIPEGASNWPQTFTPNTGPSGSVTSTVCPPAAPATPVPALPLFGLGILVSLLGLFGLRKLRV